MRPLPCRAGIQTAGFQEPGRPPAGHAQVLIRGLPCLFVQAAHHRLLDTCVQITLSRPEWVCGRRASVDRAAGRRSLWLGGLAAWQAVESPGLPISSGIAPSGESTQKFVPLEEGNSAKVQRLLPVPLKRLERCHPATQPPMLKQDNLKQKGSRMTKIMTPRPSHIVF